MGIDEALKLKDFGIPASLIGGVLLLGYVFRPLLKAFSDHIHDVQAERALNNKQASDNLISLIKVTQEMTVQQRERIDDLEKLHKECERRNLELESEMATLRKMIYRTGGPPA